MLGGFEVKYLVEFLRHCQFLGESDHVVNLSFGLFIILRFNLIEQQEVAVVHLETIHETISFLPGDFYRVLRGDYYFIRFNVGGYFEAVDLHLDVGDQNDTLSIVNKERLLFLVINVSRIHNITIFCSQQLKFEVHNEDISGKVTDFEVFEEMVGNIVNSHHCFEILVGSYVAKVELKSPESIDAGLFGRLSEKNVEDVIRRTGYLHQNEIAAYAIRFMKNLPNRTAIIDGMDHHIRGVENSENAVFEKHQKLRLFDQFDFIDKNRRRFNLFDVVPIH